MNNGWIKIHRKLKDKGYYKKSAYVHLWVHLLLEANHKESEFMWNGKMIIIKEGQFLTGRKKLSEDTGIPEGTVERILKMLESEQQINQEKTTKHRIITINNWSEYQSEQQMNNKRTTNEQQVDTNKNDKNIKNNKNKDLKETPSKNIVSIEDREKNFINELSNYKNKYSKELLNDFYLYWSEPSKSKTNPKMKFELERTWDLDRRLKKWESNKSKWEKNGSLFNKKITELGDFSDEAISKGEYAKHYQ